MKRKLEELAGQSRRKEFLRMNRNPIYTGMFLGGTLNAHLEETDRARYIVLHSLFINCVVVNLTENRFFHRSVLAAILLYFHVEQDLIYIACLDILHRLVAKLGYKPPDDRAIVVFCASHYFFIVGALPIFGDILK